VGRRYGEFSKLHKRLRAELPGKVLAPLPRKNKTHTTSTFLGVGGDDDASSVSSISTQNTQVTAPDETGSFRGLLGYGNGRSSSLTSNRNSPRASGEFLREKVVLYREDQRVSLRAFLRTFLQNEQIAESKAMHEFLTGKPVKLNQEELEDIEQRKVMDEKRIEEQRRFYEIARERARELDIYMERFRRDIVERSTSSEIHFSLTELTNITDGLTKLFKEIKEKEKIADLSMEYQKFAEWLRIESVLLLQGFRQCSHETELPQPYIISSLPRTTHRSSSLKQSAYTQ